MRMTQLFTRTLKQAPAGEVARNAQLLIRAGYVHKTMAGVYSFLPLGLRVLENIKQIVREEMDKVNSQELVMSTLQRKELWQETGRWSDELVDVWFKSKLQDGTDIGFGWTHEEPIVDLLRNYLKSYKDLPISVYQFQNKLRNELRAKSGIMRGREFVMKDMYSVHDSKESLDSYYNSVIEAYKRCYDRFGIGNETYVTFASGGAFTKFSHEFQTICDAGEDYIYLHRGKNIAVNEEVLDEAIKELGVDRSELEKVKTAEVGNIFTLSYKFSDPIGLKYDDKDGEKKTVFMGSYGIGVSRVMGVIAEKFADEKGLVWPENIAPFKYYLIGLGDEAAKITVELHDAHRKEILLDDRDMRIGEKLTDSELLGIPYRVVISEKTLENNQVEITDRKTGETKLIGLEEFKNSL